MRKTLFIAAVLQASFAMANYVAFNGIGGDPTAPYGKLDDAANWAGGVAPFGSSTGLVYTTVNVWLPSTWSSLAVRQTGGYIYKSTGDLDMRGGATASGVSSIYEIEDPQTDYASYTNLYIPGKLTFWSQYGEGVELSVLSGHVEVGSLNFLDHNGTVGTINMGDGILHAPSMTSAKVTVNMLANGSGNIVVDETSNLGNNLFLDFGTGNTGSFTLGKRIDGTTTDGIWKWIINNGQVSIDGVVETDLAKYVISTNGPLDSTISLKGPPSPQESYVAWAAGYGLADTNGHAAMTADPDGDWLDNLTEYGFGGNPTNSGDQGHVPTSGLVEDGGTNWLEYVYFERSNKAELGLNYYPERDSNLIVPAWTNGGISHVGSGALDADFNAVTNRIQIDGNQQFIRLRIELQK